MILRSTTAVLCLLASPVISESHLSGNPEAGARMFDRLCVSCHIVANDEGEVLAGRSARTGPNLWLVPGGRVAGQPDYNYSESISKVGEAEAVWTVEDFVTYVQDPTSWLRAALNDRRARSKMSYRVRNQQDAADIYAYLETLKTE
jgi:cytochrome c